MFKKIYSATVVFKEIVFKTKIINLDERMEKNQSFGIATIDQLFFCHPDEGGI